MDQPLVVNGIGPMLKLVHQIVVMVRSDLRQEKAHHTVAVSVRPGSGSGPLKYDPAEW